MVFLFAQGMYNISGANTVLGIRVRSIKRLNYHYVSSFELAFLYALSIVNFHLSIQSHFSFGLSHQSSISDVIKLNIHRLVSHAFTSSPLIITTWRHAHMQTFI